MAAIHQLVATHAREHWTENSSNAAADPQSWECDWQEVEAFESTGEVTTVYNFRVTEWHTYFVATKNDEAIWVHNADYSLIHPHSSVIEYGEGLSSLARDRRVAGAVREGRNVAVFEYMDGDVVKQKLFKSVITPDDVSWHSEEVAMKWFNKQGIDRDSVSRLYSEYHPCTNCDPLMRATYPNAAIEYSWPYRTGSLRDPISNAGREMKREDLKGLK